MNATEVELLVCSVITHLGLPFTLMSVSSAPDGRSIVVRGETAGVVRFTLMAGRPISMHAAIQERLEADL